MKVLQDSDALPLACPRIMAVKRPLTRMWNSFEIAYRDIRSSMSSCLESSRVSSGYLRSALKMLNLLEKISSCDDGELLVRCRNGFVLGDVGGTGTKVGDSFARRSCRELRLGE